MDGVQTHWTKRREAYSAMGLAEKPSLFAQTAVAYFPTGGHVLELGAGNGQDSRFFAAQGFAVTATDLETETLRANVANAPEATRFDVQKADLREPLPFAAASFDVVYAHLSLHYFSHAQTAVLFGEIARVLKPSGVLAFLVNSVDDPEYGGGSPLEDDFFQIGSTSKRFFTPTTASAFTSAFNVKLLDNNGESYKDAAKGIHGLIRFVGTKKEDL